VPVTVSRAGGIFKIDRACLPKAALTVHSGLKVDVGDLIEVRKGKGRSMATAYTAAF
jgi:hypothetical protein